MFSIQTSYFVTLLIQIAAEALSRQLPDPGAVIVAGEREAAISNTASRKRGRAITSENH
jgi:hypothetical protein